MIKATLDRENGILRVKVAGPLEEADFETLSALADPYIKRKGALPGLMLVVDRFPGWKNLAGMIRHFKFVRAHHRRIRRIALVTDARLGTIAPKIARHFVAAEIRRFPAGEGGAAKKWITEA